MAGHTAAVTERGAIILQCVVKWSQSQWSRKRPHVYFLQYLGGSLSVVEVASLLEQETLQRLKKECGGLQTLLKNNHQVFRVEGGRVQIRDWRDTKPTRDIKRKPVAPGALKTRLCWFHTHHPQGCPLQLEQCTFAHGPSDLRPSTRLLKKRKREDC